MNWNEQTQDFFKRWAENQTSLFQTLAGGHGKPGKNATTAPAAGLEQGIQQLNELWKTSLQAWVGLAPQPWSDADSSTFDASRLGKLFDPAEWAQAGVGTSTFDLALEQLTEGPTYATLWDLDRKIANAQKLWAQRAKDIAAYYRVVQEAWERVPLRFTKELGDPAGAPLKSGRALIDLWVAVANDTLLEMHRSEKFLDAQQRMTRSATAYRLQERELAEAFCAMHHIPTRTEVDEVQRMVWELRRELRALRRELAAAKAPAANRSSKPPRGEPS